MAKRKQLFHPDEVKQKIRVSQLINRLHDNAFADEEILTAGQINSINSLLDRAIPRLKAVEHSGELTHNVVSPDPMTPEQWAAEHADED